MMDEIMPLARVALRISAHARGDHALAAAAGEAFANQRLKHRVDDKTTR